MKKLSVIAIICLSFVLSFSAFAQSKAKKTSPKTKKTTAKASPSPSPEISESIPQSTPVAKKNERPEEQTVPQDNEPKKKNRNENQLPTAKPEKAKMPYIYEFSQPNFVISHIVIEHDEAGKGTITFEKKEMTSDPITDPVQLSPTTLERINKLFETLNFLASTEDYQYSKDFSHLGNHAITLRKDGQERTAKYNWTDNKDAKALVDEYRKIGEQFIWYFDMNISRENQPLEAPSLVDRLDSLIRRNEISDPAQMLPYLKDLSNDERIPLLARNKTTKLIKEIEKKK
jgi:type IV secretory pathway VirB10-like protein